MSDTLANSKIVSPEMLAVLKEKLLENKDLLRDNIAKINQIDKALTATGFLAKVKQFLSQKTVIELKHEKAEIEYYNLGLQQVISDLELGLKQHLGLAQVAKIEDASNNKLALETEFIKYSKYPQALFDKIPSVIKDFNALISSSEKERILRLASVVIYSHKAFNSNINAQQLKQAYDLVTLAKNLNRVDLRNAVEQHGLSDPAVKILNQQDEFYTNGAKQVFDVLAAKLAKPWHNLRILYAAGYYSEVQDLLSDLTLAMQTSDNETISDLTLVMSRLLNKIYHASATEQLAKHSSFTSLPKETQNQLIEQQSYISKLQSNLMFLDAKRKNVYLEELRIFLQNISSTITNVLDKNLSAGESNSEFRNIQQNLNLYSNKLKNKILSDHGKEFDILSVPSTAAIELSQVTMPQVILALSYFAYQNNKSE